MHCTGYLKSWAPAKIGVHDQDAEGDVEACNLSCLVKRLFQITILNYHFHSFLLEFLQQYLKKVPNFSASPCDKQPNKLKVSYFKIQALVIQKFVYFSALGRTKK